MTVSNTLSPDQIASFQLTATHALVPEGARVSWGDGEVQYAATKGLPAHESGTVANTPEARAYVRAQIAAKLKTALEKELAGTLAGTRPVRLEVTVNEIQIASVLQRILVGGGHSIQANATLLDAKTGAVLLAYPGQVAASAAGQGLVGSFVDAAVMDAPIDRVVASFATQYRRWLSRSF